MLKSWEGFLQMPRGLACSIFIINQASRKDPQCLRKLFSTRSFQYEIIWRAASSSGCISVSFF